MVETLTADAGARKRLGQSLLFRTRAGVRYRLPEGQSSGDGESHRDLYLATFAELGMPLSAPVVTEAGTFTLRDLLRDSIANYDSKQREIAWTAIAYVLYLPVPRWKNRDEEEFSFDDLASELLIRPLAAESCGGTHLLYAMTLLLRRNDRSPCITPASSDAILTRLRESAAAAMRTQSPIGYWTYGWDRPQSSVRPAHLDTAMPRLLITGHLTEWMQYLPALLQPPSGVYERAARWLLAEVGKPGPIEPSAFCPWTHAVCAARNLIERPPDSE